MEDRGVILATVNAPDGATLEYTAALHARDRAHRPGATRSSTACSSSPATRRCRRASRSCAPSTGTTASAPRRSWRASCSRKFAALPGVTAFPITPPSLGQGFRERPINFVIVTSDTYENLARVVAADAGRDGEEPRHRAARQRPAAEQARDAASRSTATARPTRACSVDAVARTIETMLGGRNVTRYKRDAEQYDVIVQTDGRGRTTPEDIEKHLRARPRRRDGAAVGAGQGRAKSVSPRELNHFNQRRSVTITANLAPGYSLGEALAVHGRHRRQGAQARLRDRPERRVARVPRRRSGALALVFVLALLFIFLVLAAQFESFVDPFVIMLSVPLSMVGALGGAASGRAARSTSIRRSA